MILVGLENREMELRWVNEVKKWIASILETTAQIWDLKYYAQTVKRKLFKLFDIFFALNSFQN